MVSQEYVGILDTWDIEVDNDTHLFALANGIICSNTQGALHSKHSGGAFGGTKKTFAGFDVINRFVQTPEEFPDRATVASMDGFVTKVVDAPQGGTHVYVGDEQHYVPPGFPVLVKEGDEVEAGDQLSEGLVDPGDVVRLRGLGEGRRYYSDRLKEILDDSGMAADRRDTEMLARAALNHVKVDDAADDAPYLPGDTLSYSYLSRNYVPPEDTSSYATSKAVGKFLQRPALHYTLGTRITPKIARRLEEAGFSEVQASDQAPSFQPEMTRLRTAAQSGRDWMASMHTSYLKKNLEEHAIRGDDTNVRENIHFAPRLAIGEGFGKEVERTGKF